MTGQKLNPRRDGKPEAGAGRGSIPGFEHIVMARIYLTRFKQDYPAMNATHRGYFPLDRLPAHTCVAVTAGCSRGKKGARILRRRHDRHSDPCSGPSDVEIETCGPLRISTARLNKPLNLA